MPTPLVRVHTLRPRGVTETAALWPAVRIADRWGHRAAHVRTHEAPHPRAVVKRRLGGRRGAMTRDRAAAGTLAPALGHFRKVSRRSWPGRFHCSEVPALPRTNNALEQCLGAHREHARRSTGRTGASPALGLRGSVQLIAATATRLRVLRPAARAPEDVRAGQSLRYDLETRRHRRTLRRRVRRDPASSLAELEVALLKLTLPP